MNPFTTLALRSDRDITPLSRSGSDIAGYVFRDADDAIEYANANLSQNADEWVTESHDFNSLMEWVNA